MQLNRFKNKDESKKVIKIEEEIDPSKYLLRIGVTPDCNFKCIYCNPEGSRASKNIISDEELINLLKIASDIGINRVHITGGEPLIRKNLCDILKKGNKSGKINFLLTTNGSLLKKYAKELKESGVKRINVSIDSINKKNYKNIVGADKLKSVLEGLEEAKKYFDTIKLNMVVLREKNLKEIFDIIDYAQKNGFILRLSELLPFSSSRQEGNFFQDNFVSKRELEELLKKKYKKIRRTKVSGNNWACDYYKVGNFKTPVAIVYHHTRGYHCVEERCLSIRVSPRGSLAACYTMGYPTQSIKGLNYDDMKKEFEKCLVIKKNLKIEGYPLYHIPDYTLFRANVDQKWKK